MVYIIAEIGSNHGGDMDSAKRHIDVAQECGVDAVKFQSWSPDSLYAQSYLDAHPDFHDQLKRFQLSTDQLRELSEYAEVDFICSVFSTEEADALADVLDYVKIASMDITNERLIKHVAGLSGEGGEKMILSSGMATFRELERVIGTDGSFRGYLLYCVSNYPTEYSDIYMRRIYDFEEKFGIYGQVGISDHTEGFTIPIAATAMGASMIEKHFTVDKSGDGFDQEVSVTPDTMSTIVTECKHVEQAMEEPTLYNTDASQRDVFRRSAVAARDLEEGQTLESEDVIYRRPGIGTRYAVHRTLGRDVSEGTVLADNMFEWSDND